MGIFHIDYGLVPSGEFYKCKKCQNRIDKLVLKETGQGYTNITMYQTKSMGEPAICHEFDEFCSGDESKEIQCGNCSEELGVYSETICLYILTGKGADAPQVL